MNIYEYIYIYLYIYLCIYIYIYMKDFSHLLAEISGPLPHTSIVFPVCEHVAARLAIYYLVGCQSLDHMKSKSLTSIWLGAEHCWIASFCSGVNFLASAELFKINDTPTG